MTSNISFPSSNELDKVKRAHLKVARERLCDAQNLCTTLGGKSSEEYKEIGEVIESVERLLGITA